MGFGFLVFFSVFFFGCRDPVYLQDGIACDKNDVYSYGVVLLELITGRKAIQQKVNLVQWCKDILGPDEHVTRHLLPRLVDNRISLDISYDQLYEVLKVARSCVKEKQEDRPTMQDVVAWLHCANSKLDLSTSTEFPTLEQVQSHNLVPLIFIILEYCVIFVSYKEEELTQLLVCSSPHCR